MRRFRCAAMLASLVVTPVISVAQVAPGTAGPGGVAPLQRAPAPTPELRVLQQQLVALREQVAQLSARVAVLEQAQAAVGGAGGAGAAQGGAGTAGTAAPGAGPAEAPPAQGQEAARGTAVTQALFSGVVREVERDRIVLGGPEGDVFALSISPQTRAWRDGRRIRLQDIPRGANVQASYDLIGNSSYASDLVVLPGTQPLPPDTNERLMPGQQVPPPSP